MNTKLFRNICLGVGAICALALPTAVLAQGAYPDRQVTIVVGFAAGGFADSYARIIGDELAKRWGVPVVVENTAGAGGNTAASYVLNQESDGYTVLVTTTAIAINQSLYKALDYSIDDFTTVAVPASSPETIAVHPSKPGTLQAFLDEFKGKEFTFATAGVGSGSHIATEYFFKVMAGAKPVHVPFRGGALSVQAALGNQVDLVASSFGVTPQVAEGALVGLAVASAERVALMPNVPTYTEAGFPYEAESWVGFFVPSDVPADVAQTLNAAINEIQSDPAMTERLSGMGYVLHGRNAEEAGVYVGEEVLKWRTMVEAIGVTVE